MSNTETLVADRNTSNNNDTKNEKLSKKPTTLAIVLGLACVGLTLVSMHSNNNNISDEESKYAAVIHTNMKVSGELANTLKYTSDLTKQNKARLDSLNSKVNNDFDWCKAQVNVLTNEVNILDTDVDVYIKSPNALQSSLPTMLRGWKLEKKTKCKKGLHIGNFDFAGNNRYTFDIEFKFIARATGNKWASIFTIGDWHTRMPSIHIHPDKNRIRIHQRLHTTQYAMYSLPDHNLVSGRTYRIHLESMGYAMTARLYGTGLDIRSQDIANDLWVWNSVGDQKIWINDPWHEQPNVEVLSASIMTVF